MEIFRQEELRPVAIIGAMDVETNVLEASMARTTVIKFGQYKFIEGLILDIPVVLGRSFIGMTNSAAVAAIAATHYNPLFMVSEGTSGGHNPSLHRGDIVVGQAIKNIHYIYTQKRARGEGSDPATWDFSGPEMVFENGVVEERNTLYCDSFLVEAALSTPYDGGKVIKGTIGSGDLWDREIDRIIMLREKMGTDCEDMESFAVAQVCHQLGIPSLSIRIISNSELYPEEEYVRTIGEECQRFVLSFLQASQGEILQMANRAR